jgi:hypothetical protein
MANNRDGWIAPRLRLRVKSASGLAMTEMGGRLAMTEIVEERNNEAMTEMEG